MKIIKRNTIPSGSTRHDLKRILEDLLKLVGAELVMEQFTAEHFGEESTYEIYRRLELKK